MEKQLEKGRPGRKPGTDNKVPLTIYVEESVINRLGNGFLIAGKDIARSVAMKAVYDYDESRDSDLPKKKNGMKIK